MSTEVVVALISAFGGGGIASALAAYFLGRKQRSGKVDTTEASVLWTSLTGELAAQRAEQAALRSENAALRADNSSLRTEMTELRERILRQENRNNE